MKKLLTILLTAACALTASATNYYVSVNGGGDKDGSSWENAWDVEAFRTQFNTDNSKNFSNGDNIFFAPGVYRCAYTVYVRFGLSLHGSTDAERTVFTGDTNNDGNANRDRLFQILTNSDAAREVTIENIDFEKFSLDQSSELGTPVGVFYLLNCTANVHFKNCNFKDITNSGSNGGNGGGAILSKTSNIIVENCTFKNISANSRGAAIRLTSGANNKGVTTINNCLFEDCSITTNAAGGIIMLQHGKTLTINNSVFKNNTSAGKGGAIYLGTHESSYSRDLILNNCLIYDNTATSGGAAVYFGDLSNKSITCTNCAIDAENNTSTTVVPAINITSVGVGTYYIGAPFTMPTGVTGKTFNDISGTTLTVGETYTAGDVVPAGTALLVEGSEGSYYPTITTSSEVAPNANLLKGSDLSETTTGGEKYYKLANDTGLHGLGFYWGAANGAAFTNGAHKAYLALSGELSARSFFSFFDNDVTAIDRIATTTLRKDGKFIENGRIVIMKNGVKYNTVGQKM